MAFTATKDLILPTTVTGSWPRPRWYNANMWGRPLDTAMMDPWYREQFSDAHAIVVSDQMRAGLDILTTGDYHLDEDVAGRSWHHYMLQRWKGFEQELVSGDYDLAIGDEVSCLHFLRDSRWAGKFCLAFDERLQVFDVGIAVNKSLGF